MYDTNPLLYAHHSRRAMPNVRGAHGDHRTGVHTRCPGIIIHSLQVIAASLHLSIHLAYTSDEI